LNDKKDLFDLDQVRLLSSNLEVLEANRIEVSEVISDIGSDLRIKSDSRLDVEGTEGVIMQV
jgi:hypothetical protein